MFWFIYLYKIWYEHSTCINDRMLSPRFYFTLLLWYIHDFCMHINHVFDNFTSIYICFNKNNHKYLWKYIYFVHYIYNYLIYLYCWIALLIQGTQGTPGDVYLKSLCKGIISNLNVHCLIYIYIYKSNNVEEPNVTGLTS